MIRSFAPCGVHGQESWAPDLDVPDLQRDDLHPAVRGRIEIGRALEALGHDNTPPPLDVQDGDGAFPASSGSAVNRSMRYRSSLVSLPSALEKSDVSHPQGVCVRAGKRPLRRAARPVCAPSLIWGPGDCRTIGTHVCARPKRRGRTGTPPPEGERGHCQATPRAAARRATTAAIHRTHPGAAPRQQHRRDHRGRPENRPRPGPQTPDRHRARLRDHPGDPVSHDGDVRVVRRTTTQPVRSIKEQRPRTGRSPRERWLSGESVSWPRSA